MIGEDFGAKRTRPRGMRGAETKYIDRRKNALNKYDKKYSSNGAYDYHYNNQNMGNYKRKVKKKIDQKRKKSVKSGKRFTLKSNMAFRAFNVTENSNFATNKLNIGFKNNKNNKNNNNNNNNNNLNYNENSIKPNNDNKNANHGHQNMLSNNPNNNNNNNNKNTIDNNIIISPYETHYTKNKNENNNNKNDYNNNSPTKSYSAVTHNQHLATTDNTCDRLDPLSPRQKRFCSVYLDHMFTVGTATQAGIKECQRLFAKRKWNCTVVDSENVFGPVVNEKSEFDGSCEGWLGK